MEAASGTVAFPLLITPIESNYRACTILYRFPSNNPRKATTTELSWINVFLNSIPSFKKRAESDTTVPDAAIKADKFAQRYAELLEDMKKVPENHGGPPDGILLCRLREQVLRELGFKDIFKKVKLADVFSNNGMSFLASCQNLVARPQVIDDLDIFKTKWSKKSWKKAVIFADNSGADIILGIVPFARELL